MTTGFRNSAGNDISTLFSSGDAGIETGFQTSNGVDIGHQFIAGSIGSDTGFKNFGGTDLGNLFGNDPWVAQGYTKATMLVGAATLDSGSTVRGFSRENGEWIGALSDNSLIGTDATNSRLRSVEVKNGSGMKIHSFNFHSVGSKRTAVVINGVVFNTGIILNGTAATYDYLNAHVGQNITIYLK